MEVNDIDIDNQKQKYHEYLLFSDYSENTRYNYSLYFKELIIYGIDKQGFIKLLRNHNNKNIRPFIKTVCRCFKIPYDSLDIPSLKGRQKKPEIVFYTPEEIDFLIKKSNKEQELLIRLMYESGLRISEAVDKSRGLRKKGIDFEELTIKGIGKGNKPFTQPISSSTALLLYECTKDKEPDDLVFLWKVKNPRKKASHLIKQLQKFMPNKPLFCHAFRHSCGTNMLNNGANLREVQEYLRHERLQTVEHYTSVDKTKLHKKIIDLLEVKK